MISIVKSSHEEPEKIKNPFYCPQFIEYVLEHIMPFSPLWSVLIIRHVGILRDTNAVAENWFKMIKYLLFEQKINTHPARFIAKLKQYLKSRLLERKC